VKNYHYFLQGAYLCYQDRPTDKQLKGYIKLGPHIKAERKFFKGKKDVKAVYSLIFRSGLVK
jgi:hypothetical protein